MRPVNHSIKTDDTFQSVVIVWGGWHLLNFCHRWMKLMCTWSPPSTFNILSLLQVEHLKVSLSDLLRRYTPPVEKSQYKVSYKICFSLTEVDRKHL